MTQRKWEIPEAQPLQYATPTTTEPRNVPLWSSVMLGIFGLGLIFLGGCFLIGVLVIMDDSAKSASSNGFVLTVVLYVACFCCFSSAIWLLGASVKRLLKLTGII